MIIHLNKGMFLKQTQTEVDGNVKKKKSSGQNAQSRSMELVCNEIQK